MKVKRGFLAVFLAYTVVMGGCAPRVKTVTDLPTNVTEKQAQDWDAAVANLHKIAAASHAIGEFTVTLNKDGIFPDGPAYVKALQALGKIDQFQITAANFLQKSPNNFDASTKDKVQGYVQQISAAILELNNAGATGIKNSGKLQEVNNLVLQLTASVNLVLQLTQ